MGRIWITRCKVISINHRQSSTIRKGGSNVSGDLREPAVQPYTNIPGPRSLPGIGNTWRFMPVIGQYSLGELDRAMKDLHRRYGRMARMAGLLGHPDLLFVFDPDLIKKVFRAEDALPCRPPMPSIDYYKRTLRKDFFGDTPGVIGIHGPLWQSFRSKVNKVMLAPNAAKNFTYELDEVASEFINRLHAIRNDRNELPDDFLDELYRWSLESLGAAALGVRLGCLQTSGSYPDTSPPSDGTQGTQRLFSAVRAFFDTVAVVELRKPYSRWLRTKDWRRYVAALDVFREECLRRVSDAVEDRAAERSRGGPTPLLRQVLERTGDPRLTAVLAMDLMLVGLDTSSVSTATILYLLARNQDVQERLFDEVRRLLPQHDSPVDADAAEQMHYLRACVREALRMYPVVIGNGRCLTKDTIIGGYLVPKGVHVIFPHLVTGNDADNGFPDPQIFRPERWLHERRACPARPTGGEDLRRDLLDGEEFHAEHGRQAADESTKPHAFASLPFGYGRRMCLGRRLAEHQLTILVARVVRRYRVEYHHQDFQYEITPVYAPKNPLKFRLIERQAEQQRDSSSL